MSKDKLPPWKYYIVLYRFKGTDIWMPADERSIPHTYESYPVLYEYRERAERFATEFVKTGGDRYETRVDEITIDPYILRLTHTRSEI